MPATDFAKGLEEGFRGGSVRVERNGPLAAREPGALDIQRHNLEATVRDMADIATRIELALDRIDPAAGSDTATAGPRQREPSPFGRLRQGLQALVEETAGVRERLEMAVQRLETLI